MRCALLVMALAAGLLCAPVTPGGQLIVCGMDELFVLDVGQNAPRKVWSWKAVDRPELPESMRSKFRSIDECKPVEGGRRILITASSDGVALIERKTGAVSFYATVPNAHSAELLPAGRIVVAASHRADAPGDRLVLFDVSRPEKELFHTAEVSWAHGVVWDAQRRLLWALSNKVLDGYELTAWNTSAPSLTKTVSYELPDTSGHDLHAVAGTAMLSITTGRHCWLFDRDRRQILPHPELADRAGVKCITVHPVTGQMVWVQSEGGNWWTDKLRFLRGEGTVQLPGERMYKARWLATETESR